MTRIALLRHGHTSWNRAGRIQGRTDIPLDDAARAEHAGLRLPPPWDTADLVSSPLARARETGEIVAGRMPAPEPALTEMDWGQWEGAYGENLLADPACDYRGIESWGWDFRPPGGERLGDLRDRALDWALNLRADTVAVCHIGVMRVLLAVAHGWDFDGPAPFQVKRRRLFVVEIADGTLKPAGVIRLEVVSPCA